MELISLSAVNLNLGGAAMSLGLLAGGAGGSLVENRLSPSKNEPMPKKSFDFGDLIL